MSNMVFRHGESKKWKGVGYDWEIVSDDELQEFIDAGWFAHPDELLNAPAEPEPVQRKKLGTKLKAVSDADSN
ncbi:hypothetical protein WCT79_19175 [Pectobacterium carotovorum]|uniref:hypothetical protein n=1 Tax=Pectobacterium carotovorum TaxID=554 RepID=UPI0030185B2D